MRRLTTIALVLAGVALVWGCRSEEQVPPEHFYSEDIDGVGMVQTYDIEPDYRLVLDADARRAQDLANQTPETPAAPAEPPPGPGEGEDEGDTGPTGPDEDQGEAPAGPGANGDEVAPPAPDF